MSFWKSNSNPDLAVTGTATSRHERPHSGKGRQRPHSASKGSTKSHIFGIPDTPKQQSPSIKYGSSVHGNSVVSSTKYSTPEAPRPGSGRPPKYAMTVASDVSMNLYFKLSMALFIWRKGGGKTFLYRYKHFGLPTSGGGSEWTTSSRLKIMLAYQGQLRTQ